LTSTSVASRGAWEESEIIEELRYLVTFNTFSLGGVDYPLGHLASFNVVVPAKDPLAMPAVLRVTFSHHVFSVKWHEGQPPDHEYVAFGEKRSFCPARYGCSIELPSIINYHVAGKAFQSRDGNGVLRHFFYAEVDGIPYPVFFKLSKARSAPGVDGLMHIISAYQNLDLPARHKLQSVKFARLVHTTCPPQTI
jgi:hypothetical protein